MVDNYIEKVYAGFLGMNVGIRLGAPVEPAAWTSDSIREVYSDVHGYLKQYKNFAADDDANGPYYFFRALRDHSTKGELTPEYVERVWLDYTRKEKGMFWWGGVGVSTCHTAYMNLVSGIHAPMSGSSGINGKVLSNQIGGQIFIDTWGLAFPGNPERAALYASMAASVSHDEEALNGAKFIAACIALAFTCNDVIDVVKSAIKFIPEDCEYHRVVREVVKFYYSHGDNFYECLEMLHQEFPYENYGGVCPIIPNAGVCVLALLYGRNSFNRTVEIATLCGWDTDCNAGNVGTIAGVLYGLNSIDSIYRDPINDGLVMSGISGYLNIVDIPTFVKDVAYFGYILAGEDVPENLELSTGILDYDFSLRGSTHNIRVSDDYHAIVRRTETPKFGVTGCVSVSFDRVATCDNLRVFFKTFYSRSDFSDERYRPVFSPKAYNGQTVELNVCFGSADGNGCIVVSPYHKVSTGKIVKYDCVRIEHGKWSTIKFMLKDYSGSSIDEVGLIVESFGYEYAKSIGSMYISRFKVYGPVDYFIDMSSQKEELETITPFAFNDGSWNICGDSLELLDCDNTSIGVTGNYYMRDSSIQADVRICYGGSALLVLRAMGAYRFYAAGIADGFLCIWKRSYDGLECIAKKRVCKNTLDWNTINFSVSGTTLKVTCGIDKVTATDDSYLYGMAGVGSSGSSHVLFRDIRIKGNII